MTATEKLRHLLDERCIEWGNIKDDGSESDYLTGWQVDGDRVIATEWPVSGGLTVEVIRHHLTPEQAIEATLERGTCRQVIVDCYDGLLPPFTAHCSACGEEWGFTPNFCPNCGREVKL